MKLLLTSILLSLVSADQIFAPSNVRVRELQDDHHSHRDTAVIETIETDKAPAAIGPYSQAKKVTGGTTIYVAGQIALNADGEMVGGGDISGETEQVFANAGAILEASGATFGDVVKTTVLLADINDFAAMNEVYASVFEPSGNKPARSTFAAKDLPKGVQVEIEFIAQISSTPQE